MVITCGALARRALGFQFSVRGMFLAITICGVWLGLHVDGVRRQKAAVRAIRAQAGEVLYDFEYGDRSSPRSYVPGWLFDLLGEDFFCDVADVTLDVNADDSSLAPVANLKDLRGVGVLPVASRVTDAGVAWLAGLTELSVVGLPGSQITDESLRILGRRRRLTDLYLPGAHVSDAGLAYLRGNSELYSLVLGGNAEGVTDAGMPSLSGMLELECLDLRNANVSSNGLEQLQRLTKLRRLCLSNNTRIGDDGLRRLAHLSGLEVLELANTGATSKGLEHLKGLTNLRTLDLSDNRGVTDDGIARLSALANLEFLELRGTAITSDGVRHMRRLAKLYSFDLSENAAIKEDVLPLLTPLAALEWLDLHQTDVAGRGSPDSDYLLHFSRLNQLRHIDLSGTGADTARLHSVLPRGCRVVGSRARASALPGMAHVHYFDVMFEAWAIARGEPEDREYAKHADPADMPICGELLEPTLCRMLAVCELAGPDAIFGQQRGAVEAFARRLSGQAGSGGAGRDQTLSDLLASARSNVRLRRLYLMATDFELADALAAHVKQLEEVKEEWALTDVESDDYIKAPRYLRACLRDAGANLGLQLESASEPPPDEIIRIWKQTRRAAQR